MLLVGLTGGIGSGKSTVAALLADRGAVVVDADQAARQVVAPGGPAYHGVVERFGPAVVRADGAIDRPALAALVFSDPAALADLDRLTHPAVEEVMAAEVLAEAGSDHVVVLDVPLLAEKGGVGVPLAGVMVVDAPVEVAIRRLVDQRGMTEDGARARVAAQATREERRRRADLVIDNSADLAHLAGEVERAWTWIQTLSSGPG